MKKTDLRKYAKLIAVSGVRDLSMHTELCTDAYVDLHEAGKLTNKYKKIFPGKGVAGFAFGTTRLYDWLDETGYMPEYTK